MIREKINNFIKKFAKPFIITTSIISGLFFILMVVYMIVPVCSMGEYEGKVVYTYQDTTTTENSPEITFGSNHTIYMTTEDKINDSEEQIKSYYCIIDGDIYIASYGECYDELVDRIEKLSNNDKEQQRFAKAGFLGLTNYYNEGVFGDVTFQEMQLNLTNNAACLLVGMTILVFAVSNIVLGYTLFVTKPKKTVKVKASEEIIVEEEK